MKINYFDDRNLIASQAALEPKKLEHNAFAKPTIGTAGITRHERIYRASPTA